MKFALGIYSDENGFYRVYEDLHFDYVDIEENGEVIETGSSGILTKSEFKKLELVSKAEVPRRTEFDNMKLTRDIWKESRFGYIVEYKSYKWFVSLDTQDEIDSFERFLADEYFIDDDYTMENTLHEKFCVYDIDED